MVVMSCGEEAPSTARLNKEQGRSEMCTGEAVGTSRPVCTETASYTHSTCTDEAEYNGAHGGKSPCGCALALSPSCVL
jgi:hypothetical protein